MAIRSVVCRGYGNGTFTGTIPFVVTAGYAIGAAIVEDVIQTLANVLTAARIAPDLVGATVIPDSPHITALRSST